MSPADYPRQIELANAGSGLDRTAVINDLLPMAEYAVCIDVDGQSSGGTKQFALANQALG